VSRLVVTIGMALQVPSSGDPLEPLSAFARLPNRPLGGRRYKSYSAGLKRETDRSRFRASRCNSASQQSVVREEVVWSGPIPRLRSALCMSSGQPLPDFGLASNRSLRTAAKLGLEACPEREPRPGLQRERHRREQKGEPAATSQATNGTEGNQPHPFSSETWFEDDEALRALVTDRVVDAHRSLDSAKREAQGSINSRRKGPWMTMVGASATTLHALERQARPATVEQVLRVSTHPHDIDKSPQQPLDLRVPHVASRGSAQPHAQPQAASGRPGKCSV